MELLKTLFHTLEDFSVRFAETDAAGIVHFTHFLRWAENAECDFFAQRGLKIFDKTIAGEIHGWPRVDLHIRYRAPARYADKVRVRIRPTMRPQNNARSISWQFEISRVENNDAQTLLAEGEWTTLFAKIGNDGKIKATDPIPEDVFSALKSFFEE